MKKIAFVINYIAKNGPSNVIVNIIKHIDREKFDPCIITLFDENDFEILNSLRYQKIKIIECKNLSRMKCILGRNKEFFSIVENEKIDIIHTHGFIPDILSSKLKLPIKKVSTIHNNMFEDYLDAYGRIKSHVYVKIHINALKHIEKNICCSKSVYNIMRNYLSNVSYIYNGIDKIDCAKTVTRKDLNIPENAKIFIYAGVLNSRKNVVWLIDNFLKYHNDDEYLIVLGDGEQKEECENYKDKYVKILGFKKNILEFMLISDIYISASKSEGFSISVLEALSQGLGLFLSDIPSHREVMCIDKNFYLGETFKENTFESSLIEIRKHVLNKQEITRFQNEQLSAIKMTKQYEYNYLLLEGKND